MSTFEVIVGYNERVVEMLHVTAEDADQAEFNAMNIIRDGKDVGMSDIEILEVKEIG